MERRVNELFYVIAFIITMALTIYVAYEPIGKRMPASDMPEEKPKKAENENPELAEFLRDHLFRDVAMEFKSIKDSKTGYYYEKGNFSLTLFDYPGYVTAQFFQTTPYLQLADMRVSKNDTNQFEVNIKNAPEDSHALIRQIFEKVKSNHVRVNQVKPQTVQKENPKVEVAAPKPRSQGNQRIEDTLLRINALIEAMGKESKLLSMELKHNLRSIVVVDLPDLMGKYKTLKNHQAETEKESINSNLLTIEEYLNKEWQYVLELKRSDYRSVAEM